MILGVLSGNDPAQYRQFATWLGRKPPLAALAFNQSSPTAFEGSIAYMIGQAKLFMADGASIAWSVPFPGKGQLEAIQNSYFDRVYKDLAKGIVAATPGTADILVRLPWEFNLAWQENAAKDLKGNWNHTLFIGAWSRLSLIFRAVSPRFKIIWCPNVLTSDHDPMTCLPPTQHYDIIAQDFYMQKAWNKPGDFNYFLNEIRGLQWAVNLAKEKGKLYAVSEEGMDDDIFADDMKAYIAWKNGLGALLHHACWWDYPDPTNPNVGAVIDSRLSTGNHPALGALYKAAYGGTT